MTQEKLPHRKELCLQSESSPKGLLSLLYCYPQNAASYLLTPSNARWVTATNLLPSLPILLAE